jgi:23S rRNA (guanosine2251-2'-O)-methyltransferase
MARPTSSEPRGAEAVLTGFHAIEEAIKAGRIGGRIEYADPGPRVRSILELASARGLEAVERTGAELERRYPLSRGIAFVIDPRAVSPQTGLEDFLARSADSKDALVLVLDHLSDPHNFGAIIRSADQFGADLVITPSARSVRDTETVFSSSAGAAAWVPQCVVPNLRRALDALKDAGFWAYAASMDGKPAWEIDLSGKVALILGSEGRGVGRLLSETADDSVAIPSKGMVDSLNVSVAAGILMYEVARSRAAKAKRGG